MRLRIEIWYKNVKEEKAEIKWVGKKELRKSDRLKKWERNNNISYLTNTRNLALISRERKEREHMLIAGWNRWNRIREEILGGVNENKHKNTWLDDWKKHKAQNVDKKRRINKKKEEM